MDVVRWLTCGLLLASVSCVGCGSAESTSSPSAAGSAAAARDTRDAKQVLGDFLQLKRQGNHAEADNLLSDKAREVINKVQLRLDPPASDIVRTEIGDIQNVDENRAHVPTKWTQGEGDDAESLEIVWKLRNDPPGWRVIGATIGTMDPTSKKMVAIDFEFENEEQLRSTQAQVDVQQGPAGTPGNESPPVEMAKKPK
jgi:hypothetical protein